MHTFMGVSRRASSCSLHQLLSAALEMHRAASSLDHFDNCHKPGINRPASRANRLVSLLLHGLEQRCETAESGVSSSFGST